jgi:drug/metabolite transporter (DMT)-like permease
MVMFSILILEGVKRTSGTDAGIITATMPAMVAVLGIIVFREHLSFRHAIAISLAVTGVRLIHFDRSDNQTSSLVGNLMIVGAVFCEAVFVILAKQLSSLLSPVRLALGANVAGLLIILPLSWSQIGSFDYTSLDVKIVTLSFWYILAASVIALLLWYRALPYVETFVAGLMTTALPLSAMLVSVIFLGEMIGKNQIIGAILVTSAIWIGSAANMRPFVSGRSGEQ